MFYLIPGVVVVVRNKWFFQKKKKGTKQLIDQLSDSFARWIELTSPPRMVSWFVLLFFVILRDSIWFRSTHCWKVMKSGSAAKLIVEALLQRFLPLARRRIETAQAQVRFLPFSISFLPYLIGWWWYVCRMDSTFARQILLMSRSSIHWLWLRVTLLSLF